MSEIQENRMIDVDGDDVKTLSTSKVVRDILILICGVLFFGLIIRYPMMYQNVIFGGEVNFSGVITLMAKAGFSVSFLGLILVLITLVLARFNTLLDVILKRINETYNPPENE